MTRKRFHLSIRIKTFAFVITIPMPITEVKFFARSNILECDDDKIKIKKIKIKK
jgi:hypothetical protein